MSAARDKLRAAATRFAEVYNSDGTRESDDLLAHAVIAFDQQVDELIAELTVLQDVRALHSKWSATRRSTMPIAALGAILAKHEATP